MMNMQPPPGLTPTPTTLPISPVAQVNALAPNFVWAVATSAFQIEGAPAADGKGPSIWDTFCRRPGAIADASNGDTACDHYRLWNEDLDLIAGLGVDAYRFSISWPRIFPQGGGTMNEAGMAFYERLVDGLLARGVKAYVTLNHWDLPQALQDQGGWANRATVQSFVEYAQAVAARLGDRVAAITTHNEPWVMATLGNEAGIFAPGIKDRAVAAQVSHHLLLSHGLALKALRAQGCRAKLGIVLNLGPMHPASDSQADIDQARLEDGRLLRWYADPLFEGRYPQDVLDWLGADAPKVEQGDMAAIATAMDYLGVNYYTRSIVSAEAATKPAVASDPKDAVAGNPSGRERTDMDWEVYPEGLTELLLRLHRDYPLLPPMMITENGAAYDDPMVDGRIHDRRRTDYLARHIGAMADAMRQGVRMEGYMVWSLFDNFEWASGYEKRFGIVHVDYETQVRTLKDSALWLRGMLKNRGA